MPDNVPLRLPRDVLREISKNQRWIRFMEQLSDLIPSDTSSLSGRVEEVEFESGLAAARAQQALDMFLAGKSHASFFDTTDQAASAINTPTAVTFNTTQAAKGISKSGSQISVVKSGLYEIEFRIQL